MSVQRWTPSSTDNQGDKSFYRLREGATCRNSAVSSDGHLRVVTGGLTSVVLIVSGTVGLQFQVRFLPIS